MPASRDTPKEAGASAPSQAPEGGLAKRLLGRFHVTGSFWYRLHHRGLQRIPRWSIRPLIILFTTIFFLVLRKIRRAIAQNLIAPLGPCGWIERQRRIYRTMRNLAWSLTERYERLNASRSPTLSLAGDEHWEPLLERETGVVIVTAHIGNWETSFLDPRAAHDRHLHIVREEENDPEAQDYIRGLIESQAGDQVTVHFAKSDDFTLATRLLTGLRRGDLVAVQGDRPRTGSRTVPCEIFGRPMKLPSGPAALCRAAEVPMLPVFSFRSGRLATEVVVRPPIWVERSRDQRTDLRSAMQKVAGQIEWAIRQDPYQWYCFRDLWKGMPTVTRGMKDRQARGDGENGK